MHNVRLVLKISSATWEYFPKCFMLFLQTYMCSLIRTLLYLLAESLWLLRIVSLWTAVSCMLYNAVIPLPHSSVLQRQLSQDLHWCNCSQVLWFFAVLQNAVIWTVFALLAVTDVAVLLQVGDIVSVIDMPPKELTTWWRGKHGFQVGTSFRLCNSNKVRILSLELLCLCRIAYGCNQWTCTGVRGLSLLLWTLG